MRRTAISTARLLLRPFQRRDVRNLASRRVMENIGTRQEATLRQHRNDRGVPADAAWYGILRNEWSG